MLDFLKMLLTPEFFFSIIRISAADPVCHAGRDCGRKGRLLQYRSGRIDDVLCVNWLTCLLLRT